MENEVLKLFRGCANEVQEGLRDLKRIEFEENKGIGADGTPIKGIDEKAESIALKYFRERFDYSILSEEIGIVNGEDEGTIIMDPIDGTSNAILGIPFYCISLAYTSGDMSKTEVGYVKDLTHGKEYYGVKGEGSYVGDEKLFPQLKDEWNFSVYLGEKAHPDCFEVSSIPRRTRSLGSAALEICMVAEGALDLYYLKTPEQRRSLRITDLAAASLILREAGGQVYDGGWNALNMDLDPKQRKDVIALYDERIRDVIR